MEPFESAADLAVQSRPNRAIEVENVDDLRITD
jgi:hypothetical protein